MAMQPQDFLRLVRKWALPVIALAAMGAAVAFGVSEASTPVYQAKGSILVVAGLGQNAAGSTPVALNISAAEATTTAASLITSPSLLQQVIDANHLNEGEGTLAANVSASPQTNSELVDVAASDPSPARAATIANAVMTAFVAQVTKQNTDRINQASKSMQSEINQAQAAIDKVTGQLASAPPQSDTSALRQTMSDEQSLLNQLMLNYTNFRASQEQNLETVSVAAPASTPAAPYSPRVGLNVVLGAGVGFGAALILVALLEYLDQGLKTAKDVDRRLGVPCLGVVPRFREGGRGRGFERELLAASEAYRRVRANLLFASPDVDLRSVVITSARPGEGKTQTAAQLARAVAGTDQRVILVDGDMRRPRLHQLFNRPLRGGLSEMIMGARRGEIPSLNGEHATTEANLALVTSGMVPANPSELLSSKRAALLLRSFEAGFDLVVIDTPPVDAVPDALSLAAETSATIVIVEAGKTNATHAAATISALQKVGANVVGVVLNKARERARDRDYYQYLDSEATLEAPRRNQVPAPPRNASSKRTA